jgi:hypothetical protein
MKSQLVACALACVCHAQVMSATVSAPATEWAPLLGDFDFTDDQPSGLSDLNIVGEGTDYGLFVTYNEKGKDSTGKEGSTMGFRLRLDGHGGNAKTPKYQRAAYLGIDADFNDTIDVLIGLNFTGAKQELGIYAPGAGANNSPSSLSVEKTPFKTYVISTDNYNYRPVDHKVDGGTTSDLNPGKKDGTDYYLSMLVDFSDVVAYLAGKNIIISEKSSLRFVASTSVTGNDLNGDIAGVGGGQDLDNTWSDLGVFTEVVTVSGSPIPEPSAAMLCMAGACLVLSLRRR